jgi:hypothetical protein
VDRVSGFEPEGRGFESLQAHVFIVIFMKFFKKMVCLFGLMLSVMADTPACFGKDTRLNLGGFAVITSPLLQSDMAYSDGGDLVVNFSSINKDAAVLRQRNVFLNNLEKRAFSIPDHISLVELSGQLAIQAGWLEDFQGRHHTDLWLTDAELDTMVLINRWMAGLLSLAYNDTLQANNTRIRDNNVGMTTAFITLGDTPTMPWRLTAGQLYMPFGRFSSFLAASPFNRVMFRTLAQGMVAGYHDPNAMGPSANVFIFHGSSHAGDNDVLRQWGIDGSYNWSYAHGGVQMGASYIASITDAGIFQTDMFLGQSADTQAIQHRVPGADIRMQARYQPWTFMIEYTTALQDFAKEDMTFNDHGAHLQAVHGEIAHSFMYHGKPGTLAFGADRSWEALALHIPAYSIGIGCNWSFAPNTVLSFNISNRWSYDEGDRGQFQQQAVTTATTSSSQAASLQVQTFF